MKLQLIILISLLYLVLLFCIAFFAEKKSKKLAQWFNNPYIYTLSLAIYCSAWTFYGSVGKSAKTGLSFISIYLGPTVAAFLFVPLYQKFLKIKENTGFSSLADFISLRYGRNIWLGAIVTFLCIIGIVPYIALQLKSISGSILILSNQYDYSSVTNNLELQKSTSIYLTVAMCIFIMIYGFRSIDASEKRRGLITAVAFESIFKLIAFLVVGATVVFLTYRQIGNPFNQPVNIAALEQYNLFSSFNQFDWVCNIFISFFAFLFLPRQFQVGVVDNNSSQNLRKASWLFPLYLLLINIFVLPIAMCGNAIFQGQTINSDHYVIALPLFFKHIPLSLLAYLGGFSAASSMVIVETIALSMMLVNNIILPIIIWSNQKLSRFKEKSFDYLVLNLRRAAVVFIISASFLYEVYLNQTTSLVNIGLMSFVAVAQFAPAIFGGLFWQKGNSKGIYAGLFIGFVIWFYLLMLPSIMPAYFANKFSYSTSILSPNNFLGMQGFSVISVAFFWSLFFNTLLYCTVSVFTYTTNSEREQAEIFLRVIIDNEWVSTEYQHSKTKTIEIKNILLHFIGKERFDNVILSFQKKYEINTESEFAQPKFIQYSQRVLSGILGVTSARLLFTSIYQKSSQNSSQELLTVLTEKQEIKLINKELVKKQEELEKATRLLKEANDKLKLMDEKKDEFLYTITHELRTPLTSIRALSEIILDNPDIEIEQKNEYIAVIVKESERLTHLINQVLTLEKMESGFFEMEMEYAELSSIISEAEDGLEGIIKSANCQIHTNIQYTTQQIYCDFSLIQQVVSNLISNAVKFASKESPEVWIDVTYEKDLAHLMVSDNGEGIDEYIGDAIFNKFLQAKNRRKIKPQGSGLGLAICKRILDLHNASIAYEPKGKYGGASFYFEIPLKNNSNEL